VRIEPAGRLAEPRFATVDLAAPTNIVTLLPSGPGYLMFVGYAA
jgi:hypothetical protein